MPSQQLLNQRRRTKIVCTIGPATSSEGMIRLLIRAGMDCARLNFSHGTLSEHERVIKTIRKIGGLLHRQIAILQDLPGPKFRIGDIPSGSVQLNKGLIVTLTTAQQAKQRKEGVTIPLRTSNLPHFASVGGMIFLSDGAIRLKILDTTESEIKCRCEIGGVLLSGKGVNVPDLRRGFQTFTTNDRKFLSFGLAHNIDLVAVSFVRKASDIDSVRRYIKSRSRGTTPIVSKIEKKEAVENIEEITEASDAVMVARGDLGVENPLEQVPELQKRIISICNSTGRPVITATQMLESMVANPSPTRAEVTDVANAIFDGTDALMLSEETAVGKYPIACVETLDKVSLNAEEMVLQTAKRTIDYNRLHSGPVPDAVCAAAVAISDGIHAKAIVTPLDSMSEVSIISKFRPIAPIVSISKNERNLRSLKIIRGVYPLKADKELAIAEKFSELNEFIHKTFPLKSKEKVVLVDMNRELSSQSIFAMSAA